MNTTQALEMVEFLTARFPKWESTTELLDEWRLVFEKYDDPDKVREGIRELLHGTSYTTPMMKQIFPIMSRLMEHPAGTNPTDQAVDTKFYIQCVEAPDGHPGYRGWFIPVCFANRRVPDEKYWRERGLALMDNYQNQYGGRWQLVDCSADINPELSMNKRRAELRNQKWIAQPRDQAHGQDGYCPPGPATKGN